MKPQKDMAKELEKYKDRVFCLTNTGKLQKIWLNSLNDYNHSKMHLHHYIEYNAYAGNENWYIERGIEQKLFLISIPLHEQIHGTAIKNLSDEDFYSRYKINRYRLIFNKKYSKY